MSYLQPSPQEVEERRAQLAWADPHNERILLALFATICCWREVPKSYLDLGSGTGAMVNMARKLGVDAWGVDLISEGPGREHWFIQHDLSQPMMLSRNRMNAEGRYTYTYNPDAYGNDGYTAHQFDIITCLEVAEHLPEEGSRALVDTIGRHISNTGVVIFSAAPPGQGGEHHVNNRPAWEWRDMFYEVGLGYQEEYTRQLSHLWSWVAGPLQWLGANVQVFAV